MKSAVLIYAFLGTMIVFGLAYAEELKPETSDGSAENKGVGQDDRSKHASSGQARPRTTYSRENHMNAYQSSSSEERHCKGSGEHHTPVTTPTTTVTTPTTTSTTTEPTTTTKEPTTTSTTTEPTTTTKEPTTTSTTTEPTTTTTEPTTTTTEPTTTSTTTERTTTTTTTTLRPGDY